MEFYNIEEEKSYTLNDLKRKYPNVSFPRTISEETLTRLGYAVVFESPRPTPSSNLKMIQRDGVELSDDKYSQKWKEVDKSQAQLDQEAVNEAERTRLQAIADAQEASDLKQVTVAQGTAFITNKLTNAPNTVAGTKQAVGEILIKMLPFILK